MKYKFRYIFLFVLLFLLIQGRSYGQENVLTVGIQYKPIIPGEIFNTGSVKLSENNIDVELDPRFGNAVGMVVRKGITESVSIETGLNFVRRNYDIHINDLDSSLNESSDFKFIGYEMPVLGLVYVQLGKELFMNAAGGVSLDFFPSDIFTADRYYAHSTIRRNWIQTSLLANIGFEYRTRKSGYFYLGASFHRPFRSIAFTGIDYIGNSKKHFFPTELSGNYLTLDIRYFFHEDPENKKRK